MKKPLFCLLTVLTPFLLLESTPAGACTNFIVTRGASTDSTTLVSYSADSHALYGCLYKFNAPKGGFRPGEMLSVYEWDTGRYLGDIPQVEHPYSTVGNMNEHSLIITETTYGGRGELADSTGRMDYGSMIYITLQRARTAREAGIPYVILEMNPDTVSRYGGKEPIHGGDASKPLVLEHFGIQSARVIAVVISDPSAVRAITAVARKLNPKVHIVVRTRFLGEVDALRRLGANDVIPEDFETSIEIFSRVLGHYLVPRQTIERFVNSIRHEYYNMARQLRMTGMDLPSLADEVLTGLEVVACKVEPGCALDGKRLMDTSLRKKYGVTVVGIRHAGQIIPSPGGDAFLHGDDTVFLSLIHI